MSRFFFILFLSLLTLVSLSQNQADSLLKRLDEVSKQEKIRIYNELSEVFLYTDTARVFEYARKALGLASVNKDRSEQARAHYLMGEACYYSDSFLQSVDYYKKALDIYINIGDTVRQIETCNSIGLSYYYLQKFEQAIQQYFSGLKLAERVDNEEQKARLYSNTAMVYSKMRYYQEALINYRKALNINRTLKRKESVGVNLNGIGVIFFRMNEPDSAKVYYLRALDVFRKINNQVRIAILLNNIANIYVNQKDSLSKALDFYEEAEKIFTDLGDNLNVVHVIEGIGGVYREMKQYDKAVSTYQRGVQMVEKQEPDFQLLQLYYSDLASVYEVLGDYNQALRYEKIQHQYADSLLNTDRIEQISRLEKQFETEKKEAEIGRLKAEQELILERQKRDKYQKVLALVSMFFLLVALFYVSYRYAEKKSTNKILAEKNRQIKRSEEQLRILNAAKNKFFSIIAHDLKSPFHMVMGYSQLLSKDYDLYSHEDRKKFARNIYKSANVIFRLLSNLLDWSRSQTDHLIFNPVDIEFVLIFENVINLLKSNADQKKVSILADFDETLEVFADPVMLETVIRNLVGNAIKYSEVGGRVVVSVNRLNHETIICVKDDGIGINVDNLEKLFQIDSKIKQKGTLNEDGSGIGLILCKELIDKHQGRIWAESTLGRGSCFYIGLPLPANSVPDLF